MGVTCNKGGVVGVINYDTTPGITIQQRKAELESCGVEAILYTRNRVPQNTLLTNGCRMATGSERLLEEVGDRVVIVNSTTSITPEHVLLLSDPPEGEALCLSGIRFDGVQDGRIRMFCKCVEFDRLRNRKRYSDGDSGDEPVHVPSRATPVSMTAGTFGRLLSDRGDEILFNLNELGVAASDSGVRVVVLDPEEHGVKWSLAKYRGSVPVQHIQLVGRDKSCLLRHVGWHDPGSSPAFPGTMRNDDIVVSVSTYRARFPVLEESLGSLLGQTVQPWKICVAVDSCDIPYVPEFLKRLQADGAVEIMVGDRSLGPHNKYVHAMTRYPDKAVITFDDDAVYRPNAIEELVSTYRRHPDCVVARRVHLIRYGEDGAPLPYKKWVNQCTYVTEPSFDLCATGVGGVLYPPGMFSWSDSDLAAMRGLKADDLFLKKRENDLGIRVVYTGTPKDADPRITRDGAQEFALLKTNVNGGNNDVEIRALGVRNMSGDACDGPFFRVVIPVYNSTSTLKRALDSIRMQTFDSYAVSVCDDGSSYEFARGNAALVAEFGDRGSFVHTDDNRFAGAARNTAMESFGDAKYTLFLDADDRFAYDSLFSDLYRFIRMKSFPDVVVLPFFDRSGKSTVGELSKVDTPKALSMTRITGVPWAKCIRTDKVQRFSEGLRRSNDVMQHYLTVDTVSTVAPFGKEAVRYMQDSETTMFGPYGRKNRKSVHALSCYLRCVLELMHHEWVHDYAKDGVSVEIEHILKRMVPGLVSELGVSGIKGFFKSGGANASV